MAKLLKSLQRPQRLQRVPPTLARNVQRPPMETMLVSRYFYFADCHSQSVEAKTKSPKKAKKVNGGATFTAINSGNFTETADEEDGEEIETVEPSVEPIKKEEPSDMEV
jgi:hypothetical protein